MKRSAILSLMFIAGMLAVPGVLNAQVEKRVEVSKAYVPSVEHATKLAVRPNMVDTAAIQPEIDYSTIILRIIPRKTVTGISMTIIIRTIRGTDQKYMVWREETGIPGKINC